MCATMLSGTQGQLELMMICALEAGQALREHAFRIDVGGDTALLGEPRQMLVRYLALPFLAG